MTADRACKCLQPQRQTADEVAHLLGVSEVDPVFWTTGRPCLDGLRGQFHGVVLRGPVAQGLVGAVVGVVVEVCLQSCIAIGSAGVTLEVDLLVLHRSPQPLDHHVVDRAAFPVHTDLDRLSEQPTRELLARELRSLVGVEDLRTTMTQGLFEGFHAELYVHAV